MKRTFHARDVMASSGILLLVLSYCGFFGSFFALGANLARLPTDLVFRAAVGFGLSFAVSCLASFVLRSASLLWQVPLFCFGWAALVIGVSMLLTALFTNWQLLFGMFGVVGGTCLLVGTVVSWAMHTWRVSKHGA